MEGPVIIVIDALDEFGDPTSWRNLLVLLAQEIAKTPNMFHFLITSQAEFDINSALATRTNIIQYRLSIKTESNINDISFFLRNKMATIRDHHFIWASFGSHFYC